MGQSHGHLQWNGGAAPFKCRRNRPRQPVFIKFIAPAQDPHVVEIFHSAVDQTQHDHGLKLFGNHRLAGIDAQSRLWQIEQDRQIDLFNAGFNGVAKAYVNDDGNPRTGESSGGAKAQAAILKLFADQLDAQRIGVEHDAVVYLNGADLTKRNEHRIRLRIAIT